MRVLTKDDTLITLTRIGEAGKECGSARLFGRTETGHKITITADDIKCFYGSIILPPDDVPTQPTCILTKNQPFGKPDVT